METSEDATSAAAGCRSVTMFACYKRVVDVGGCCATVTTSQQANRRGKLFKITVTAKGSHEVLAQFSAATQAECFAWAEKFWLGDRYNWSTNFTGYEAGIGGAL